MSAIDRIKELEEDIKELEEDNKTINTALQTETNLERRKHLERQFEGNCKEIVNKRKAIRDLRQLLSGGGNQYSAMFDEWDEDDAFDFATRPVSPWPSLIHRAKRSLQKALRTLGPPINAKQFNHALNHAEELIRLATREVQRVMLGSRRNRVLDQLGNALMRIRAARAQARGRSLIPGGRSLINPKVSVRGAIEHLRLARQAVGLQLA